MANTKNQKRRRAERTRELLNELSRRFPACFHLERKKVRPVAIGIQERLSQRLAEDPEMRDTPQWLIKQALARYTRSPAYLEALAAGKPRLDLDGNHAGEISEEIREHARERREEQKRRAAQRRREQHRNPDGSGDERPSQDERFTNRHSQR